MITKRLLDFYLIVKILILLNFKPVFKAAVLVFIQQYARLKEPLYTVYSEV